MDIVGIINPIPINGKIPKNKFLKRDYTQKTLRPMKDMKRYASVNQSMETIVEEKHLPLRQINLLRKQT